MEARAGLIATGFKEEQAEMLIKAVSKINADYATKADLQLFYGRLSEEIASGDQELRSEIQLVETKIDAKLDKIDAKIDRAVLRVTVLFFSVLIAGLTAAVALTQLGLV